MMDGNRGRYQLTEKIWKPVEVELLKFLRLKGYR